MDGKKGPVSLRIDRFDREHPFSALKETLQQRHVGVPFAVGFLVADHLGRIRPRLLPEGRQPARQLEFSLLRQGLADRRQPVGGRPREAPRLLLQSLFFDPQQLRPRTKICTGEAPSAREQRQLQPAHLLPVHLVPRFRQLQGEGDGDLESAAPAGEDQILDRWWRPLTPQPRQDPDR